MHRQYLIECVHMTTLNCPCSHSYLIGKRVFSRWYWASSSLPGRSRSASVANRMSFSCRSCSVVIRRQSNFFTAISVYGGYSCNLLLVWEGLKNIGGNIDNAFTNYQKLLLWNVTGLSSLSTVSVAETMFEFELLIEDDAVEDCMVE